MNTQSAKRLTPYRCPALLWALFAIAGIARADQPGSGELRLLDKTGASHELAGLDTDVDYRVSGLVADVAVRQQFHNLTGEWLQGQYLLPLPPGAAVYSMTLHIGDRTIVGEIHEKRAARQVFAQARDNGQRAALVEADGSNLFRTAVTNVAPNDSIEIELHYWQRVDYDDGLFSLRFPLTYTPRYHMQNDAQPEQRDPGIQGGQVFASATDEPPLSTYIRVALDPGMPLASVTSSTHAIVSTRQGDIWNVHLRDASVVPDRDFILQWKPEPNDAPTLARFSENVDGENYVMLMLMPPQQQEKLLPRELILVIDTSGSMGGESIRQARAALDMALRQLRPSDRFNVIEFNSVTNPWQAQAVDATLGAVTSARQWVAGLQTRGGTEMGAALHMALSGHAPAGYVRQVVFATDGAVDNPAGLMQLIDNELGDSRLFPIGIGSAPNAGFLRNAAVHGRGSETVIANLNQVGEAMRGLLAKLDHPAMRELQVDWPPGSEAYPRRIPDLYLGEPLLLIARVAQPVGAIQVRGKLADDDWDATAYLDHAESAQGLDKLWAKSRIADLEDQLSRGGNEASLHDEIVDTALKTHLVSRFTSLVAVDETPVRAADSNLQSTQIPNVLPLGSAFAQTATPARLQLLIALFALLLTLYLWRIRRAMA